MEFRSGELNEALRIVEEEGYAGVTESEQMALAVELMKVSALREIAGRLRHMEQTLHEIQGGD